MGRVVGAFGLNGWVKVKVFTESADTLGTFPVWLVQLGDRWREMALEDFEVHSKGPVAKLAGCDDRNAADALRGADVAVTREALGDAEDGTLYWVDLVGLEVVDEAGKFDLPEGRRTEADRIGDVKRLDRELARTLYLVVKRKNGGWGFPSGVLEGRENLHQVCLSSLRMLEGYANWDL